MRYCSFPALLCCAAALHAQPHVEPKDGKVTIPITLSPTALPKPLSRFYLTPQYAEMQPGNRIPTYMKSYMEQANFFSKDPALQREKWNDMKLEDLPLEEMKKSPSANLGGLAYREGKETVFLTDKRLVDFAPTGRPLADVDEASRLLTSDWQIWFNIRRDGIGTLLPEVQKMRELAAVLKVRMRYEIATKDFEKAAYSARTYYGLVQSFETHPTLIASLVGLAIEAVCLNALEEMIQQPGCPNLYWSFTEIPAGGIDLRTAIQGEKLLCQTLFGPLLNAKGELSEKELNKVIAQTNVFFYLSTNGNKLAAPVGERYAEMAKEAKKVAAARALLLETGFDAGAVKAMPALQAIATADVRRYQVDLDEIFRSYHLPNAEAVKLDAAFEAGLKGDSDRVLSPLALPTVGKVRSAAVRLQQRVAYLRVIEALRLHAFDNAGKLPAALKDVKSPLPMDPVTGEAFVYSVKDGAATLTGGNPSPAVAATNRVYEIRIRK